MAIYVHSSGHQRVSDREAARDLFSKALREDPKYAKAAYNLAITCQQLSDSECALKEFKEALRAQPDYVDDRLAYAGALIDQGDADEAIRQLREVIRLDPGNASGIQANAICITYGVLVKETVVMRDSELSETNAGEEVICAGQRDESFALGAEASVALSARRHHRAREG